MKETSDAQEKAQLATTKYFNIKKEADESPLAVLRNELGTKQLEIVELEQRLKSSEAQKEEFRTRYEQVKKDMVALKRQIDREKEETLDRQAKELEQLKGQMRLNEARDAERREFEAMRN